MIERKLPFNLVRGTLAWVVGIIAVPLTAVQYDNAGEFINRVNAAGALERVNVTSGQTIGDLVVVTGNLKLGDNVELIQTKTTTSGGGFGG